MEEKENKYSAFKLNTNTRLSIRSAMLWDCWHLEDKFHDIKSEIMVHGMYEKRMIKELIAEFIKALDRYCELHCDENI